MLSYTRLLSDSLRSNGETSSSSLKNTTKAKPGTAKVEHEEKFCQGIRVTECKLALLYVSSLPLKTLML